MILANPHLEVYLTEDYDLLESRKCICGQEKEIGQTVCASCWLKLPVDDQVQIAMLKPGDGLAAIVRGMLARISEPTKKGWGNRR